MKRNKLTVIDLFFYPFLVPNFLFLKTLVKRQISPKDVSYNLFKNSLFIKRLNCTISKKNNFFLLQGLNDIYDLMELCNAEFKIDENDKVTVNIQGLNISINFWEEINIMKEIFKDGVYNVETNDKFVFVDIGMNVGMTSLFFSKNPNTIKTYSFEPFPKTYEFARKNIDQNPSYAPKINSFNYGVGETKEEKSIDYFLDYKGSVGTDGIPDRVLDDSVKGKMTSERVVLESAETVVTKIRGENPGLKLYAKIDCEGAEYGILKQLSDKNLLKEFELIMMEWHNEGPVELVEILKKNGFISYSFWPNNNDIGMIYSFRSS